MKFPKLEAEKKIRFLVVSILVLLTIIISLTFLNDKSTFANSDVLGDSSYAPRNLSERAGRLRTSMQNGMDIILQQLKSNKTKLTLKNIPDIYKGKATKTLDDTINLISQFKNQIDSQYDFYKLKDLVQTYNLNIDKYKQVIEISNTLISLDRLIGINQNLNNVNAKIQQKTQSFKSHNKNVSNIEIEQVKITNLNNKFNDSINIFLSKINEIEDYDYAKFNTVKTNLKNSLLDIRSTLSQDMLVNKNILSMLKNIK